MLNFHRSGSGADGKTSGILVGDIEMMRAQACRDVAPFTEQKRFYL
jgi:hypothetical protein